MMQIAILSDIHEDIRNLEKAIKRIESLHIDKVLCLGDISGFSSPFYKYKKTRSAHHCLTLLREKQCEIVAGNHDFYAAGKIPQESDIFDFPENWFQLNYEKKKELSKGDIWLHEEDELQTDYTSEDLDYLKTLPEFLTLETSKLNILFSHYAFPNLSGFRKGFYSYENEFRSHFHFMKEKKCEISFTGHSHVRGMYYVNPERFKHHRYKKLKIKEFPACIGIPPVTRHKNRSGFCIFNPAENLVETIRL